MTGIKRLRELADKYAELGKDHTTIDVVPSGMAMLFSSIANQIEREHAEDCYGMGLDHGTVSRVITDMERHVSGVEGMEDSPVARWARDLREALGGRDEEEVADVATIRKDAMEAYEWMREHGGLDSVKKLLDWVVGHCSTKQQLDFDFWLSGRVMHELGFDEDMADRDEVERRLLARLMPEGCEWPRYESGEPVRIGDAIVDGLGHAHEVSSVEVFDDAEALHWSPSEPEDFVWLVHGERAKRPAPKVLDADGVEIRVGDEVWDVETGCKRTVRAVNDNETVEFDGHENRGWFSKFLTHRAPVLAADGKPLRVGDTVFNECGDKFTVSKVDHERGVFSATAVFDGREGIGFSPIYFSHERPDSWERLEEDATLPAAIYCERMGIEVDEGYSFVEPMARDLVRRAKVLAGVSE